MNQIVAGFNKKKQLIEFKSEDGSVQFGAKGINLVPFPCTVCSKEVSDEVSGEGLRCEGCMENFHNQCTSDPMSTELYKQLRESTPDFIKVFCPTCMSSVGHNKQRIEDIAEELAEVKETINSMKENISKPENSTWASTVAAQKKVESTVNNNNRLLQNMARKKEPESPEERANKQARTLMVKQYKD